MKIVEMENIMPEINKKLDGQVQQQGGDSKGQNQSIREQINMIFLF